MNPKYITIHASATENRQDIDEQTIRQWHLARNWVDIGYHQVILTDGQVRSGRPVSRQGAHTYGHNKDNIGICLIGGVDSLGDPVMNFTEAQIVALLATIRTHQYVYGIPDENVKGHRDYSPDLNMDGVITPKEWLKQCPCLDIHHLLSTGEAVFYEW